MDNPYKPPAFSQEPVQGLSFEFVFKGKNVIATGSYISGLEKILIDGEVVSIKRTYKRRSKHYVEIDGIGCEIELRVISMLTGRLECLVYEDDKPVARYKLERAENHFALIAWIGFIVFFGVLGFIKDKLKLPNEVDYIVYGLIVLLVAIVLKRIRYRTVKVEKT